MELSQEMQSILEETAEEFANAEAFDDWMPPDGDYTVLLTNAKTDVKAYDDGSKMLWVRITGRILADHNPEVDQKEFTAGFFSSKAYGILKQAANVLKGSPCTSNTEAIKVLMGCAGTVVILSVKTKPDRKNNAVMRTNVNIQKVVSSEPVPEEIAAE